MINTSKFCLSAFLLILISACGNTPNLEVTLTDTPIQVDNVTIQSVNITISDVSVHNSASAGSQEAGWKSLNLQGVTNLDLLSLQGEVEQVIGTEQLEPGAYQQIRITVESASVVVDGVAAEVTIPSGVVRIPLNNLVIEADKKYSIALDFNAQTSLSLNGNSWRMSPVITLLSASVVNQNGTKKPL